MSGGQWAGSVVLLGAGGHAKVIIEAIRAAGFGEIVGLVDPSPPGPVVLGLPVLGGDDVLPRLREEGMEAVVLALGGNALRQKMGERMRQLGFRLPVVVHPSALVSPSASLGDGAVIMARAVVGTEASVGDFAIINTSASIDHDNVIGDAAHVAPGCALAGNVRVGARALVGVGSAVRPGVQIGEDAVVGAGSSVVSDIAARAVVGGAPARSLVRRNAG